MTYQRERQYIFQLLNTVLSSNDVPCETTGLDWNVIYKLCKYHKIDNMVAYKVCSEPFASIIPEDIVSKFRLSLHKAKVREAVQHIEYEQLQQLFEENKIRNIPLKGSILKYYYPSPDMRFMMDLDILC